MWRVVERKIHILFYGDNACTVALKMDVCIVNEHRYTYKFHLTYFV